MAIYGMGCGDANGDGRRDYVRLRGETLPNGDVRWSRTIVRINRGVATDGPTDGGIFKPGRDDVAIRSLAGASCGSNSLNNRYR